MHFISLQTNTLFFKVCSKRTKIDHELVDDEMQKIKSKQL